MALLLDEPPVVVQPSLVRRLGLLEAAVIQQLHYWSQRATCVHEGESWVYKTYAEWADEIGVTAKAVRGALDRLRKDGAVLAIQNPTDPRDRTLWWRIDYACLSGSPSAPGGSSTVPAGESASAPAGSSNARAGLRAESTAETTSREPLALARPIRKVTYRGRTVPRETAETAERLLAVFNDATGSRIGGWTGDGRPSADLKQIIGALIERPGHDATVWEAAVRNVCADPPDWIDSRLSVGHVFGPKAAGHALASVNGNGAQATGRRLSENERVLARWAPRAAEFDAVAAAR